VASRDEARAKAFAARHGAASAYSSYEALMRDASIDVVYIATPNEHHREHALLAIAAGKAVLCEKPLALTAADAEQIAAAARRAGVFCMEAMWMRCSRAVQEALSLVQNGAIGRPHLFHAELGFVKDPALDLEHLRPRGGGALLDLGVYPLAMAQAFLGTPQTVQARIVKSASGVDEDCVALLSYASGAHATVSTSFRCQLGNAAWISGPAARITLVEPLYFPIRLTVAPSWMPGTQAGRHWLRELRLVRPLVSLAQKLRRLGNSPSRVYQPSGSGYTFEAEEVMRCLREGSKESPLVPLADSIAVLDVVDRIRAAADAAF
jgi:predicted dehydrogenase